MTTACLPEEASLLCSPHTQTVSVRCAERQNKPDNLFLRFLKLLWGPGGVPLRNTPGHNEEASCNSVCVCVCSRSDVTLILEDFQSLGANDKRLQRLLVIFLTPECSLSAVSNPVELILQENRGM